MDEQPHRVRMPLIFNEWMRRYIEEPEKFQREWELIRSFLKEENGESEPTYGQQCTAYVESLAAELFPA